MSVSIKPLSVDEFLAWERAQPLRYEFDGIQPVGMTGGSNAHARLIARLITAASNRVKAPCEVFASELKIVTATRVRYPDVTIACGASDDAADTVSPTVVFEVTSPSTFLTDHRVKTMDYRSVESLEVYVIVSQDEPQVTVRRRAADWIEEKLDGRDKVLHLPEAGISLPLEALYW